MANQKELFLDIVKKYNVCSDELLEFLEVSGFYNAPASTSTRLHNAYDGGLVDFLITLARRMLIVNDSNAKLDVNDKLDPESVVRVAILHGIGKAMLYVPNPSEWYKKNLGNMYEFNDKLVSMSVGERSIYYIYNKGNMKLTEEEHQAILNAEKSDDKDMMVKWYSSPLTDLIRDQLKWAIRSEKRKNN